MPSTLIRALVLALLVGCAAREAPAQPPPPPPAPAEASRPPPPPPPSPPADARGPTTQPASDEGGCRTDADCGKGEVCIACGRESSCVSGCRTSADCPSGEVCAPVQCIRCPCPPLCHKQR